MKKKMYIKPSKSSLVAGMIVVVLMLIIGIVFLIALSGEDSPIGIAFMSVWIVFILLIGGSFLYKYLHYDKPASSDEEISFSDEEGDEITFDERLRKLEGLYKDKLITESEYRKKRNEIMQSKWCCF